MKIVVIGATGTIGSAVAAALRGRHEVVGLSRKSDPRVDILDKKRVEASS
jgi:nucleoside-diphosphate-sugar epimerase